MADLLSAFAAAVARKGASVALVEADGTRVSFDALAARVRSLAARWQADGMQRGDRILIAMPIGADLYASLAAIWTLGATAVLPEPAMGLAGLRNAIASAGVTGLCASGPYRLLRLLPALWFKRSFTPGQGAGPVPPAQNAPGDTALISFTSGTTGTPKAIPRSHAFLMAQARAVSPLLRSEADEVDLVAFPVFVLINLAEGRTSVLPNWRMSRIDTVLPARIAAWIAAQHCTRLLLPPSLCDKLAEGDLPPQVHTLFTGGGPVFPDLIARLKARAPALRIVSVYGSTEAEPIAEIDAADVTDADRAAMAAGQGLLAGHPVPAVQLRLEAGEILVAGDHVNKGYLDPARDAETKRRVDGTLWHRTGDAGRLDNQGRLWLMGRHGAEVAGIAPFAVETAARFWPGLTRAALIDLNGQPVLAVTGDGAHLPDWRKRAADFGINDLRHLAKIPLDRRHRSKTDLNALRKLMESA